MTPDDASPTGTLRSPVQAPVPVRVLRVLLYAFAGLSLIVMLGFLLAVPLPPGETVGRALWGVWPGVVAYVLAENLRRPSRLVHRLVLALGAYVALRSLSLLGDGDPRGWTTLALPVAVVVLASRRSAREWFRQARARPLARGRPGEQGTTAVEYVAILAVVAVVAAAAVAAVSSQQAMLQGFRGVVCALVAGPGCDTEPAIGAEPGIGAGPATGAVPPGPAGPAPGSDEGCRGFRDCALAFGGQVLGGVGGVGDAIRDEVTGVWDLVTDPAGLVDAGAYIWENPGDALRQLVWDDASAEGWEAGNYGEAIGRTVWNVGSWLVPGYNVGKAGSVFGDAGRAARLGDEVVGQVDEVPDPARPGGEGAAAAGARVAVNAAGVPYPEVIDLRTGSPITYPGDGLSRVPVAERVTWNARDRGAFIKEWYDRGLETPPGGWAGYDIHHIRPREYGGTNDFDNLVPVPRDIHQQQFNPWWANYGD